MFRYYANYAQYIFCRRFIMKGIVLSSNPFPDGIDTVPVLVTIHHFLFWM